MATGTQAGNLESQLGSSVLGSVVGEGMGLLFNGVNNTNQANQQSRLDQIQLGYNEQMAQYQEQMNVQQYNATSYPDQVAELNAAGLNPALLYHGAGAGGTTGPSGPSIQGAMAPSQSPAQTGQMAIANAEAQADINLKNAQANNLNAQTPQEAPLMQAQTLNLTQDVQNKQAQQALTQVQTTATEIQNSIQGKTIDDQVAQIQAAASTAQQQFQIIARNNWMDQQTLQTKIDQTNANLIATYINNNLQKSNINVNQEQIQQIANQIVQSRAQTAINRQQTNINDQQQQTNDGTLQLQKLMFQYKMDQQPIDDLMNGIHKIMPSLIVK